jgi:hypothetical protein
MPATAWRGFCFFYVWKEKYQNASGRTDKLIYAREVVAMQPQTNWAAGFALRVIPLGHRSVRKPNGKVYRYLYLRLDAARFPEALRAYRLRLVIVPPDLSAPPVIITARIFQRSSRTLGFDVDKKFQALLEKYNRGGYIAVLASEVLEEDNRQNKQAVGESL